MKNDPTLKKKAGWFLAPELYWFRGEKRVRREPCHLMARIEYKNKRGEGEK